MCKEESKQALPTYYYLPLLRPVKPKRALHPPHTILYFLFLGLFRTRNPSHSHILMAGEQQMKLPPTRDRRPQGGRRSHMRGRERRARKATAEGCCVRELLTIPGGWTGHLAPRRTWPTCDSSCASPASRSLLLSPSPRRTGRVIWARSSRCAWACAPRQPGPGRSRRCTRCRPPPTPRAARLQCTSRPSPTRPWGAPSRLAGWTG